MKVSFTTEFLKELYDAIPTGKKNALPGKEIRQMLGFDTLRDAKKAIATLRENGAPICADISNTGGYFKPENVDEAKEYLKITKVRIASERRALKAIENYCREGGEVK